MYAKNRTPITGLSAGVWNTVDLDSFITVEGGSNFAIIIATNTTSTAQSFGVRDVGSAEGTQSNSRIYAAYCVQLNAQNEIQVFGNAASYFIIGVGDEIEFLGTPITKNLAQSSAWQIVDLSGDGLDPSAAYVVCKSGGTGPAAGDFAVRAVGETFDDAGTNVAAYNRTGEETFVVPVNASGQFEVHNGNASGQSIVVIGWLPADAFVWRTNAALRTPSTASAWEDFPDVDATILIALIEQKSTGSISAQTGVRSDGSSVTAQFEPKHCTWWSQTTSGVLEYLDSKTSAADTFFAFRGGFKDSSIASGAALAATAADIASASADLTTQVKLAAAAANQASASAALTTAIRLAANAASVAASTGTIATGALLAAQAADVVTATAALSTAIQARGQAVDTATATGALTNWATVTLSGTLYTGQGGALDPNFWVDSVPQLGTTLYYDATHIAIAPNGEISSDVPNCAALVQFFDGTDWALGLVVFTDQLAAVAKGEVSASAQLSTAINLAAAASALATVTGAFSTGAGLTGTAEDAATATGALTTKIPLSGLALNVAEAVGALTTQITLFADASAESEAHGSMNGVITLQGAANAVSAAAADLTTRITPAANAQAQASGAASLTTEINARAAAVNIASAAAALNSAILLIASAASSSSSSASLTTSRPLVAAAIDVATAVAVLSTGIDLKSNATAIATATASLTANIDLFADAASQASATAILTDIIDSPPIDAYPIDPRFVISRSMVDEEIGRRTPRFITKDPLDRCVLCFDFSDQLEEGETLTGRITLNVAAIAGNDPSATGVLVGVPSYDSTKTKILQPIQGGRDGCKYYVKVAAGTNNESKAVSLAGLLPVAS